MRIFFIGSVKFSKLALCKLISMRADVVGVCTLEESSFNSDHHDLSETALAANIPVRLTPNINDPTAVEWIKQTSPDVIFCFGWSRLLGEKILEIPRIGVIGFHPSALPANRGRHPIIWALVLGLKETASTFFFMDGAADTGDILSQVKLDIYDTDDASSLYDRISTVALNQIEKFVPLLETGKYEKVPQDNDFANTWRKRTFSDGCIDWRMSAQCIHNLVRGLATPYAGASFIYKDESIKVWKTSVDMTLPKNFEPGRVIHKDNVGVVVKTGDGAIRLLDCSPRVHLLVGDYL